MSMKSTLLVVGLAVSGLTLAACGEDDAQQQNAPAGGGSSLGDTGGTGGGSMGGTGGTGSGSMGGAGGTGSTGSAP